MLAIVFVLLLFENAFSISVGISPQQELGRTTRTGKRVWCRMNEGVSRCVDPPFPHTELSVELRQRLGGRNWCPFRVCGPSYIATERCPEEEELEPVGLCSARISRSQVHSCIRGQRPDFLPAVDACKILGGKYCELGPVYICKCIAATVNQIFYEFESAEKPKCPKPVA